ncbi:DUF6314 family protein [Oceanicola sp. S124]|uniref:DUF6314 family protein n=1 Tax=Oceanicola sp. S124 TaxID=1042378 RepID=UPI0002557970|nr:DUF6314 family protein [Oceanicola sp. S124]
MDRNARRDITDFAGVWQIRRQIEDRLGGVTGVFTGQAELRPDGGAWTWSEAGEIRYGSAPPLRAERRYLWQPRGVEIAVHFDDGRFFHAFDPMAAAPRAEHLCTPDLYRAAYDFADWPRWQVTWEVAGPRKDYRMESLCQRP